jgi:hypothetical protein
MGTTIYIQNFSPSIIATRKAISFFEKDMQLKANSSYIFDFTNIFFISRAFADELLKFLTLNKIQFKFINANTNIIEIFSAVQKNRFCKSNSYHNIAVTSFNKNEDLVHFISSI